MVVNDSTTVSQTPFPTSGHRRSPTKSDIDLKPNPHPYAIRTTSTGVLSRSNSTSSNTTATRHRYVPPSPSRSTKSSLSSSGDSGDSASDNRAPRPLPIPPSFPSSSSSSGGYFSAEESFTPRRAKRAETLPSFSVPPPLPAPSFGPVTLDDLPSNPKLWTPAELASYLTTALRVSPSTDGGAGIPDRVAKDIATFVRDARITGRTFLRLTDVDLNNMAVNKKWAETLLNASRNLRQNVLKGRIWGDGGDAEDAVAIHLGLEELEPPLFPVDDTTPNAKTIKSKPPPITSPPLSQSSRTTRSPRPLPHTPKRTKSGKVKGMVATFERSGSFSSESGDEEHAAGKGHHVSGFGKGLGGPSGRGASVSTPGSAGRGAWDGGSPSPASISSSPFQSGYSRRWLREQHEARAHGAIIEDDDSIFGSYSQRGSPSPTRSSPERRPLPTVPRARTAPITVIPITTLEEPSIEDLLAAGVDKEVGQNLSSSWGAKAWEEMDLRNGVTVKRIVDQSAHGKGRGSGDSGISVEGYKDGDVVDSLSTIMVAKDGSGRIRGSGSRRDRIGGKGGLKDERDITAIFVPSSPPALGPAWVHTASLVAGEPEKLSAIDSGILLLDNIVPVRVDVAVGPEIPYDREGELDREVSRLTNELLQAQALVETYRTRLVVLEEKVASMEENDAKALREQAVQALVEVHDELQVFTRDVAVQALNCEQPRTQSQIGTQTDVEEELIEGTSSFIDDDFQDALDMEDPPLAILDDLPVSTSTPTATPAIPATPEHSSLLSQATSYLPSLVKRLTPHTLSPTLSRDTSNSSEKNNENGDQEEPSTVSELPQYVLMVGLGVCVVALRVILKRAGGRGGGFKS